MHRVSSLTRVFMDAGVMKPKGQLSEGRLSEWRTGVTRLSQDKVTHADKATIINAVRTFTELRRYITAIVVTCLQQKWTHELFWMLAPRALNSLRRIARQGRFSWPVSGIQLVPTSDTGNNIGLRPLWWNLQCFAWQPERVSASASREPPCPFETSKVQLVAFSGDMWSHWRG